MLERSKSALKSTVLCRSSTNKNSTSPVTKSLSPIQRFPILTRQTTYINQQKVKISLRDHKQGNLKASIQGYIPEWLTSREDFSNFLSEIDKKSKKIEEICLQHPSARSSAEKKSVGKWIYSLNFFKKMPKKLVYETCDHLTTKIFKAGDYLIKKGGEADCMFIVYSGIAGVYIDGKKVAERVDKQVVGETALDSDRPRNADVIAETTVITLQLMKIYYTSKILHFKKQEKLMNKRILSGTSFFSKWSSNRIENLTNCLVTSNYVDGQVVYEEGQNSLNLFFVQQGNIIIQKKIEITKANKWPTGLKNWETQKISTLSVYKVANLTAGDFFGVEVFTCEPRLTRAVSNGSSTCLILNRPDCQEIFHESEQQKLIGMAPTIPDNSVMFASVSNRLKQKSEKTKVLYDALNINYKDWGGRETDVEKKLKRKTRYLTSIKS